jgi:hypothetical protein
MQLEVVAPPICGGLALAACLMGSRPAAKRGAFRSSLDVRSRNQVFVFEPPIESFLRLRWRNAFTLVAFQHLVQHSLVPLREFLLHVPSPIR